MITADHATNTIAAVIERRSPGPVIRYCGAAFRRCTTSLVTSVPGAAHAMLSALTHTSRHAEVASTHAAILLAGQPAEQFA